MNGKERDFSDDMIPREELFFLQEIPGIGNRTLFGIAKAFREESCESIWSSRGKEIVAGLLEGEQIDSFYYFYKHERKESEKRYRVWMEKGYRYIPYMAREYPGRLKNLIDAPFSIWLKGNLMKDTEPSVAIIGARQCSEYGRKMAYRFGKELAECGVQIVSGMARGVDGYAQKGAIDGGGNSFAVLGCGVDICYPKENKEIYDRLPENGGIISEYAMGTQPESRLFPARNRIISGLSDLVLVVEARRRSGTYITVTQALEQGREVYAVPGRITDELSNGCHNLIKDGAGIATCPEDIMDALKEKYSDSGMPARRKRDEKGNDGVQSRTEGEDRKDGEDGWDDGEDGADYILSLMDLTPVDIETLCRRAGERYSYQELNWILIHLKIKGKVDCIGNYYFRI